MTNVTQCVTIKLTGQTNKKGDSMAKIKDILLKFLERNLVFLTKCGCREDMISINELCPLCREEFEAWVEMQNDVRLEALIVYHESLEKQGGGYGY